jgi:hypothetical protein
VVATKLCQIGGVSGFTFDLPPTYPVLLSVWCSPAFDNTSRVCLCAYRTGIGYSGVVAGPVSRGSFPRRSWFGEALAGLPSGPEGFSDDLYHAAAAAPVFYPLDQVASRIIPRCP